MLKSLAVTTILLPWICLAQIPTNEPFTLMVRPDGTVAAPSNFWSANQTNFVMAVGAGANVTVTTNAGGSVTVAALAPTNSGITASEAASQIQASNLLSIASYVTTNAALSNALASYARSLTNNLLTASQTATQMQGSNYATAASVSNKQPASETLTNLSSGNGAGLTNLQVVLGVGPGANVIVTTNADRSVTVSALSATNSGVTASEVAMQISLSNLLSVSSYVTTNAALSNALVAYAQSLTNNLLTAVQAAAQMQGSNYATSASLTTKQPASAILSNLTVAPLTNPAAFQSSSTTLSNLSASVGTAAYSNATAFLGATATAARAVHATNADLAAAVSGVLTNSVQATNVLGILPESAFPTNLNLTTLNVDVVSGDGAGITNLSVTNIIWLGSTNATTMTIHGWQLIYTNPATSEQRWAPFTTNHP